MKPNAVQSSNVCQAVDELLGFMQILDRCVDVLWIKQHCVILGVSGAGQVFDLPVRRYHIICVRLYTNAAIFLLFFDT